MLSRWFNSITELENVGLEGKGRTCDGATFSITPKDLKGL